MNSKAHFLTTCAMAVIGLLMVYQKSIGARALLLIPILVLQQITLIVFSKEYDRLMILQWKEKENKLKKEESVQVERKNTPKQQEKPRAFSFRKESHGRVERITDLY